MVKARSDIGVASLSPSSSVYSYSYCEKPSILYTLVILSTGNIRHYPVGLVALGDRWLYRCGKLTILRNGHADVLDSR